MKLVLDTGGGDDREACIQGGLLALGQDPALELAMVVLTADEAAVKRRLHSLKSDVSDRVTLLSASEEVPKHIQDGMLMQVRRNRETTMAKAYRLIGDGKAAGIIAAANTAALVTLGASLGRFRGTKPALAVSIPTTAGHDLAYVDGGGDPNTSAEQLAQNLRWGAFYAQSLYGVNQPQAAFLNMGIEEGKGSEDILAAQKQIRDEGLIQLVGFGNAEPDHVFSGTLPGGVLDEEEQPVRLDVIGTGGLPGNVGLKTLKAAAKALLEFLKQRIAARSRLSPVRLAEELAALTLKPELVGIMDDYQDKVGGGTVLGIDALATKVHGSSKAPHVKGGILRTKKLAEESFIQKLRLYHGL